MKKITLSLFLLICSLSLSAQECSLGEKEFLELTYMTKEELISDYCASTELGKSSQSIGIKMGEAGALQRGLDVVEEGTACLNYAEKVFRVLRKDFEIKSTEDIQCPEIEITKNIEPEIEISKKDEMEEAYLKYFRSQNCAEVKHINFRAGCYMGNRDYFNIIIKYPPLKDSSVQIKLIEEKYLLSYKEVVELILSSREDCEKRSRENVCKRIRRDIINNKKDTLTDKEFNDLIIKYTK